MGSGLASEGIFRVSCDADALERLRDELNKGVTLKPIPCIEDMNLLAGFIKAWLRELPEPLPTSAICKDLLLNFKEHQDGEEREQRRLCV
jgi:hypothetical protein